MTRPVLDYAWIEIEGTRLEHWTRYSIDSDMATPADGFRFSVGLPSLRTADDRATRQRLRELCREGRGVRIYVGDASTEASRARALQLTGHLDDVQWDANEKDGTMLEVEGRDKALHIVDACAPPDCFRVTSAQLTRLTQTTFTASQTPGTSPTTTPDLRMHRGQFDTLAAVPETYVARQGMTLPQLARLLCEPYSIDVTVEQSACRDVMTGRPRGEAASWGTRRANAPTSYASGLAPRDISTLAVTEARPNPGETVWEYLDRHAKRLGVMMWMSATGELVLGSPQYDQPPRARLVRRLRSDPSDPNNILRGEVRRSVGDRYSDVTVYGRSGRDVSKTKIIGRATDESWPAEYRKPLVVHDRTLRTEAEAERRARRELAKRQKTGLTIKYDVAGHSCVVGGTRYVFAIDTTVEVVDEVGGINGTFYCIKRTLARDTKDGATATLVLVPKESLIL